MRMFKRGLAVFLAVTLSVSAAGCGKEKKEEKPESKKVAKVDHGTTNASRSGDGQSDAPFVIAVKEFTGNFNPFTAKTEADRQVVALTQAELVQTDRAGKALYQGINGEFRKYMDEYYTYYGTTDLETSYDTDANETKYHITLRDDLVFSDREILNVDDVIFTIYALCDKSYTGESDLKEMPVKGLLNYLANSTKAESYSDKKVQNYVKKNPKKLQRWIEKYIIKKELENGFEECEKNYLTAGYETDIAYFTDKYHISNPDQIMEKSRLLKKAFAYYAKKGYRTLAKNVYFQKDYFEERVKNQARIFMAAGKGKKVSSIAGIVRINDYELEITTKGYERKMTGALKIPICPLHYYGDKEKYNYEKNRFGFKRGDISALQANKAMPMGAGAYRYVKLEDGVAYFTSNELYFLGCPKAAFVQVKEMSDILIETKQQIRQKQAEEEKTEPQTEAGPEEVSTPAPTTNPSAELTELTQGTVDMIGGRFLGEEMGWLAGVNSNEEVSGKTLESRFVNDGNYFYLGIHAKNVSVGGDLLSDESEALRKAIGAIFSLSREVLKEENGEAVLLPNYPVLEESWMVSSLEEDAYEVAYNEDAEGEYIYDLEEEMEEKTEEVIQAALELLEKAGYTVEGNKVTAAPAGAKSGYQLLLPAGEDNMCYAAVKKAMELLNGIGITIQVEKVNGEAALEKRLQEGKQELWLSCKQGDENDLSGRYRASGAENIFGLQEERMEKKLQELEGYLHLKERQKVYKECFDMIFDSAVEVPMCEFRSALLFSSARIVRKTIPKEISIYYSPIREIQKIEMK